MHFTLKFYLAAQKSIVIFITICFGLLYMYHYGCLWSDIRGFTLKLVSFKLGSLYVVQILSNSRIQVREPASVTLPCSLFHDQTKILFKLGRCIVQLLYHLDLLLTCTSHIHIIPILFHEVLASEYSKLSLFSWPMINVWSSKSF